MAAEEKAASLAASFDFSKWAADDGFTDEDDDDAFLCACGKVHPPTYHQVWRTSATATQEQPQEPQPVALTAGVTPGALLSTM